MGRCKTQQSFGDQGFGKVSLPMAQRISAAQSPVNLLKRHRHERLTPVLEPSLLRPE
jgi:hypothetical protein